VKIGQTKKRKKDMRKLAIITLVCALLWPVLPAAAQQQAAQQQPSQSPGKKLEALFAAAEIPFTKAEEGRYIAVITVEEGESDRFQVFLTALGNDPNNEKLQVIQLYFLLGQLPKGAQVPAALIKQVAEWNANLTLGKVVIISNVILYTSSSWLSRTDADTLAVDAVVGHYASKDLRKNVEPYLKQ